MNRMAPTLGRLLRRIVAVVLLVLSFWWELLLSNIRLAADVLRPRMRMRPGIIAVPLDARTDLELVLLSNLVTLTPGTLTIDVSADRRTLYVHAMFVTSPEALVDGIKRGLERRVLAATR
jgi:multicomponent Na+:H+ antiporter subunit E